MANSEEPNGSKLLFSEDDHSAIRTTWSYVWAKKKDNAADFLMKLLKHHPGAIAKFKEFKDLPLEKLAVHKSVNAHGIPFLYAIQSYVDNVEDLEILSELIRKNARNHIKRGISGADYKFVEPALFELLEDKMPRKVTSEHKSAWKKMINLMAKIQDEENAIKLQGR